MLTRVPEKLQISQVRRNLTNLLYPSLEGGWRDIFRSGWLPGWFNQQWGGAQVGHEIVDAATGALYKFEPATGQIQDDSFGSHGISAQFYNGQMFKVSESFTPTEIWVKLFKTGNPTDNVVVSIYSDSSGFPGTVLGGTATLSAKSITSKADGEWYRFAGSFPVLVAGTQYHLVLSRSGANDSTNFYCTKMTGSMKYPFGSRVWHNGTAWTNSNTTTHALCFLIPATNKFMQSGGLFDQKLVFTAGSPVNQSKSLSQPLRNFFDGSLFTALVRGSSFTKGKTVVDFQYGLDHDRVVAYAHGTTGVPVLSVYTKSGSLVSISGTTDVSSGTNRDISVVVRTLGDGSDYAQIWVNGVKEAEVTGQSFPMDPLMRELGTAWVGGGFSTAPTWTTGSLSFFSALPSTQGWTWTGTATEANAMSVANGKLYQNKNGYASTDSGYYQKSSLVLSNTTGWVVTTKLRVSNSPNTTGFNTNSCTLQVADGTKAVNVYFSEYFVQVYNSQSGNLDFIVQGDFKSQEHVFTLCGKGSDYYLFIDGRLAVDGTNKLVGTSALNTIIFVDGGSAAGENADAVWSYVKYYTGGMLTPDSNGGSLNEFAYWSGNQSEVLPYLYNAGSLNSVRDYLGVSCNYAGDLVVQRETRRPVTNSPTTTSTTSTLLPEMEAYVVGSIVSEFSFILAGNSVATNQISFSNVIDGIGANGTSVVADAGKGMSMQSLEYKSLGLHKVESRWGVTAGTGTAFSRTIAVEAKS